jgi:hypothetical protein
VFKHAEGDPDGIGRTGIIASLIVLAVAVAIALVM